MRGESQGMGYSRREERLMLPESRLTRTKLLTKGDNNGADDTELYARGQFYLDREKEVIGSVVGYVPFVGYVTILLSEHPWLKTVMLGIMGLLVSGFLACMAVYYK